uniref:SAMD1-like winged helix (WH) domain-containing protein n=1 Tax=Catharus ustulatus TaxID=91951 RepID=A0A8C3Y4Q3_CATUS
STLGVALPWARPRGAGSTPRRARAAAAAPRYQEWILDTIDSLRSRKARPDLERICRMVRRRHGPEPERTRAELEKLIQQRAVLRVSYKGSISYRNAARVQPPRRPPPPARRPPPVSLRDTARLLGGDGRLTRGRLQGSAAPGGAGGAAGAAPPCSSSEASAREEEEEEEDEDEEDEDGTGSEASEDAGPPRQLNGEGRGGPPLRPPGQPPPERPPQAKACAPGEGGCQHMAPLKKEGCPHPGDHVPDVPVSPCRCPVSPCRCPHAGVPMPVSPCPHAGVPVSLVPRAGRKDKAVDPVDWSVRDVVEYFTEAGFPEQAGAFQEQEMDGKSLLLMQRADVLTGLCVPMSPVMSPCPMAVPWLSPKMSPMMSLSPLSPGDRWEVAVADAEGRCAHGALCPQ